MTKDFREGDMDTQMTSDVLITADQLMRCKRAVVVLAEVMKMVDQLSGRKKAPLELREDMLELTQLLRRLEKVMH